MEISLRPVNPETDFARIAELMNTVGREPVTAETLHEREQNAPLQRVQQRIAAVDERGHLLGIASAGRNPWMKEGTFWLWIIVDPATRQQGIGSSLYNAMEQFLREQGATKVNGEVRENCPDGLRFVQRRGFTVEKMTFESRLDLSQFDETPFAGTIEAIEATGIRFFSMADTGNTPEAQQRLYEIHRLLAADTSDNDVTFASFEQFRDVILQAAWFRADGQIIAADGDTWVGMCAIGYFEHSHSAYNMFTGVDRAYRGRHIALALKLLAARRARRCGAVYIRTSNDSQNAPMLAVNRKLGYQFEPGVYKMALRLLLSQS